jgi:hypothetical protein
MSRLICSRARAAALLEQQVIFNDTADVSPSDAALRLRRLFFTGPVAGVGHSSPELFGGSPVLFTWNMNLLKSPVMTTQVVANKLATRFYGTETWLGVRGSTLSRHSPPSRQQCKGTRPCGPQGFGRRASAQFRAGAAGFTDLKSWVRTCSIRSSVCKDGPGNETGAANTRMKSRHDGSL